MRDANDTALPPDYLERLFDPPCLGIPSRTALSGRAQCPDGGFVAVYLAMEDGRVLESGFLTDCPHPALLVASLWCERAQGLTGNEAAALDITTLEPGLAGITGAREAARACREAARAALESAGSAPRRGGTSLPRRAPWPEASARPEVPARPDTPARTDGRRG